MALRKPRLSKRASEPADLQAVVDQQQKELDELRKQVTTIKSEQTAALKEAQALTHLGSWQWDVATNEISWSDELYRIYGLKPQEREIGFEEFISLIHPEDQEHVQGVIGAAFSSGQPFDFEHRIILPNKRQRILHGLGKVITDKDGKPVRMLGTSQDITEQKVAELELQQSDQRFRTVTRATHDLVYDLNLHDGTIWFNEVLSSNYGYDKSQANNTLEWWASHVHPEDALRIELELSGLLQSDEATWHSEYRFQKADDSYTTIRNRAFVLRDSRGDPTRIIGSMLDITKQKQLDRAKDEFISLVSHQLRTPLTTIRLLSEMLVGGFVGDITDEQKEHTAKITNASIRLIKLVSDILNISRAELDRIKIEPVPTDVNQLIQTYIDEQHPFAQEKGTVISFKPIKLPMISLDPIALGQIIQNLLGNAVHYTKPTGGHVKVSFTKQSNGYILCVEDDGIGIPRASAGHIFDRFYRAPNTKKVEGEGTGLGLYLVKLITDTFGGQVWFESKADHGTTFYVQIPLTGMQAKGGDHNLY
jgi:PAS domain S-box-containing protein